jgi:hypothetical protein
MKNIYNKPNHMTLKLDNIWTNQEHNNLASIHFDYHLKIMILLKRVSIQNQNPKIKTPKKTCYSCKQNLDYFPRIQRTLPRNLTEN